MNTPPDAPACLVEGLSSPGEVVGSYARVVAALLIHRKAIDAILDQCLPDLGIHCPDQNIVDSCQTRGGSSEM